MKRRVLFITRTLAPSKGGMQTQVRSLIEALRHEDIDLRVFGFGGPKFLLPLFVIAAYVRALIARVDTVHVGDASLSILFPLLAPFRPGMRRTVTVHGLDVVWRFPGYRALVGFSLQCAHRVVAVSRATADAALALGVRTERLTVIPCGIAPVAVSGRPKKNQLLSVGRLVPRKGIAWFIEHVFVPLSAADASLRYVIVGRGPELARIHALITSLGLTSNVELRGDVDDATRDNLYAESAALVAPNVPVAGDMEGFGIVCIEAATRGLPVVASRLEGLRDSVIEEASGVFFAPLDAKDAADAVTWVLKNPFDPERIRQVFASKFDIALVASRYVHDVF